VSVYHSPRCRITWTNVEGDGVDRDVVDAHQPMTVYVGLNFDNNLRRERGWWSLHFTLIQNTDGAVSGPWWQEQLGQLPGTTGNIWMGWSWSEAHNAVDDLGGVLLFRPTLRISFYNRPATEFEYAVAEEDHYIRIVYTPFT
jgi:hypothetical protein